MMHASGKDFIKDFAKRTIHNYNIVSRGPYEVSQLINSAIGLLIIPEQKYYNQITDNIISAELLQKLQTCIKINTYSENFSLQMIARHVRNSIAHGKLEFVAEQQPMKNTPLMIHSVTFTDEYRGKKIEIEMTIKLLEEFFFAFATAASEL